MAPKVQQAALRKQFTSKVVTYKDSNGKQQTTKYSVYVPAALRDPAVIDLLVFFHGLLHVCDSSHNFDPDRLIKKFRLDVQTDTDLQLALAVPIVLWNTADRKGIIQAAWSAARLNAFVVEVFDQIAKFYGTRPELERLILVGHSAAFDILTPLAEQFVSGANDTKKGALKKLERVVAMDTTYRQRDAKALEQWAQHLTTAVLNLVQSTSDPSVPVWQKWDNARKAGQDRPKNLRVFHNVRFTHCSLPSNFLVTYNYSFP